MALVIPPSPQATPFTQSRKAGGIPSLMLSLTVPRWARRLAGRAERDGGEVSEASKFRKFRSFEVSASRRTGKKGAAGRRGAVPPRPGTLPAGPSDSGSRRPTGPASRAGGKPRAARRSSSPPSPPSPPRLHENRRAYQAERKPVSFNRAEPRPRGSVDDPRKASIRGWHNALTGEFNHVGHGRE